MSQPAPQEKCAAEGIRQRAEIRYPKGVIYPITVHGMKGAMEDLAATQRRAEESEKREQELQREFLDRPIKSLRAWCKGRENFHLDLVCRLMEAERDHPTPRIGAMRVLAATRDRLAAP